MLAYTYDNNLRKTLNDRRLNYWEAYIQEINEMLGLRAYRFSLQDLEDREKLKDIKTLILGHQSGTHLTDRAINILDEWVKEGGVLVGFAPKGMDEVFGIKSVSTINQEPDDYTISGYFDLRPHPITHEIHPFLAQEQKLLVLSDIQVVEGNFPLNKEEKVDVELARLYDTTGKDLEHPAITWHSYGNGYTGYFAFDVAKTIWVLHQGRPITVTPRDRANPRLTPRTSEMQVIGNNSRKAAYADEIAFILQNMVAQNPQPFIYQIPPDGDKIPDALLYWGGDEYVGPVEYSLDASDWMKSKGLPYHINIQENHPITDDQLQHILQNGHEVSLYYHLYQDDNFDMAEEHYIKQNDIFYKRFGYRPVCTVNYVCRWKGWSEPAKWMLKAGGKADNSFQGSPFPGPHPLLNSPFFSFGFGTSYPFYFYEDYTGGNQRIDFLEEPIVCYEVGHRGSIVDKETVAIEDVHPPVDMAIKYHMVMNMFYHPTYIARYPICRQAIEEMLRYIDQRKAYVKHMGNNQVWEWWDSRSRSTIDEVCIKNNVMQLEYSCEYPSGMILKIPLKDNPPSKVTCDGELIFHKIKKEFGHEWLFFIVPHGKHTVSLVF